MAGGDATLLTLVGAIVANDVATVAAMLEEAPSLAMAHAEQGATRQEATTYYLDEIGHYLYGGDTALHIAAAAYRVEIVELLITAGADVSATNRRGAQPLHYAADGQPGSPTWNPEAQAAVVHRLIAAGADPDAPDKSGVAPLHRAVRTRCAAAVQALVDDGADVERSNKKGSTPLQLASWTTGRGGSGTPEARQQQDEIRLLLERALSLG